jgi:phosphotransferase family enzyme
MNALTLAELPLPGPAIGSERLGERVWRVRIDASASMRSLIAKCLPTEVATRVELVARRWLPEVGLAAAGPPLWRVVPSPDEGMVWHLYEDLGDWSLDETGEDENRLRAMVALVARVHRSFASHSLLGEVLGHGRDLSAWVHESTIRGVVRTLETVRPESAETAGIRSRLLARFLGFLEEAPARAAELRATGHTNTLVHGDLWPKNGIVVRDPSGPRARLIDWDGCGVGSAFYDLSALLSRLPIAVRGQVVTWYCSETDLLDQAFSSPAVANRLAETCERTRLAEWSIWRVRAIPTPDADWAWRELARVEAWLDVRPLFPQERQP